MVNAFRVRKARPVLKPELTKAIARAMVELPAATSGGQVENYGGLRWAVAVLVVAVPTFAQ